MTLSIRQRLIILRVSAVQRGDLLSCELWDDIKAKVVLTEEENSLVFKKIEGTDQMLVDLELFDKIPAVHTNLEKQERRCIKEALPQYKNYEPGEPVFVRELIKNLEESLTGA